MTPPTVFIALSTVTPDQDTARYLPRYTRTTVYETSGRISLYLPDKTLKKRLRVAAPEADITISALFTEWAEE